MNTISFVPCVYAHQRRKDGTYNVKVRVTFKGKHRNLATTLWCTQQDLTRSLKLKNGNLVNKANDLCSRMRSACSDISPFDLDVADVDWVVAHIRQSLASQSFRLDFFEWADSYILTKTETTRRAYSCALATFARFLGGRVMDINDITRTLLLSFMEFVDAEPKMRWNAQRQEMQKTSKKKVERGASTRHIMKLANIYHAARDRYNDEDEGRIVIPRDPFAKIPLHFPQSEGQRSVGLEVMQRIVSAQTDNANERMALDVFVVSFGLMGANFADLWGAVPFSGEVWVYNRQKTRTRKVDKAEMHCDIDARIKPFLARLRGVKDEWWLGVLHRTGASKDVTGAYVNRYLKAWANREGLEEFTLYAARHTWASLAYSEAKVEMETIDQCLTHNGDYEMARIYTERDWKVINDANRKVLDLLRF